MVLVDPGIWRQWRVIRTAGSNARASLPEVICFQETKTTLLWGETRLISVWFHLCAHIHYRGLQVICQGHDTVALSFWEELVVGVHLRELRERNAVIFAFGQDGGSVSVGARAFHCDAVQLIGIEHPFAAGSDSRKGQVSEQRTAE